MPSQKNSTKAKTMKKQDDDYVSVGEAVKANPIVGRYVMFSRTVLKVAQEVDSASPEKRGEAEHRLVEISMGFFQSERINELSLKKTQLTPKTKEKRAEKGPNDDSGDGGEKERLRFLSRIAPLHTNVTQVKVPGPDGKAEYRKLGESADRARADLTKQELLAIDKRLTGKARKVLLKMAKDAEEDEALGLSKPGELSKATQAQADAYAKAHGKEKSSSKEKKEDYVAAVKGAYAVLPSLKDRVSTNNIFVHDAIVAGGKPLPKDHVLAAMNVYEELVKHDIEVPSDASKKLATEGIPEDAVAEELRERKFPKMAMLGRNHPVQLTLRLADLVVETTEPGEKKTLAGRLAAFLKLPEIGNFFVKLTTTIATALNPQIALPPAPKDDLIREQKFLAKGRPMVPSDDRIVEKPAMQETSQNVRSPGTQEKTREKGKAAVKAVRA